MLLLQNLKKITIFFRMTKPTVTRFLKFFWNGFCKTTNIAKTSKDGRHLLYTFLPFVRKLKEVVLKNTLNDWYMEQVFFFFFVGLHLDNHSFKIARKFYLPHLTLLHIMWTNLKLACYFTSGTFSLFINNYCWPPEYIIP